MFPDCQTVRMTSVKYVLMYEHRLKGIIEGSSRGQVERNALIRRTTLVIYL